jgi:hypothetical protein
MTWFGCLNDVFYSVATSVVVVTRQHISTYVLYTVLLH